MNDVAVVIVTYNSEEVIGRCLKACSNAGAREIIVVDNASTDATCSEVRRHADVKLIENAENLGFAAAVNRGIEGTGTRLALLLNPDTEVVGGVDGLAGACELPGAGAAAGMLTNTDDVPQTGFNIRRLPSASTLAFEALGLNQLWRGNPVNRRYRCLDIDPSLPGTAEQPAGAFLMIRRDAWSAVGGLDEAFHPLWFEDVDFCKRLRDAGYSIHYTPAARARHLGGHSVRKISSGCRQVYWYASLLKYASKHFTRLENIGVSASVMLGSVPRVVTGIFLERNLQPFVVFGRVVRLAAINMVSSRTGEAVNSPVALVKSRRGTMAQN